MDASSSSFAYVVLRRKDGVKGRAHTPTAIPIFYSVVASLLIVSCLTWLAATACALNPDRNIHQLVHRSWGEKDGYPGRTQALAQTKDGFLWVGSDVGLFRFDGVHFERYVPSSGDKLPQGVVRNLLALSDGSLWVAFGDGNGISVLRNGNVKSYGKV